MEKTKTTKYFGVVESKGEIANDIDFYIDAWTMPTIYHKSLLLVNTAILSPKSNQAINVIPKS